MSVTPPPTSSYDPDSFRSSVFVPPASRVKRVAFLLARASHSGSLHSPCATYSTAIASYAPGGRLLNLKRPSWSGRDEAVQRVRGIVHLSLSSAKTTTVKSLDTPPLSSVTPPVMLVV